MTMQRDVFVEEPMMGGWAGAMIGLWKRGRMRWGAGRVEKQMKVLETMALGGKRQLLLVACGEQQFLVGVGADGVQMIVALTTEDARG